MLIFLTLSIFIDSDQLIKHQLGYNFGMTNINTPENSIILYKDLAQEAIALNPNDKLLKAHLSKAFYLRTYLNALKHRENMPKTK